MLDIRSKAVTIDISVLHYSPLFCHCPSLFEYVRIVWDYSLFATLVFQTYREYCTPSGAKNRKLAASLSTTDYLNSN